MLLCKEFITAEDSPHVSMYRITKTLCSTGVLVAVSVL